MAKPKQADIGEEIDFNFPAHDVTIKARSQEEALEKFKSLKAQKND